MLNRSKLALAVAVALGSTSAFATDTFFDVFTPLPSSAGPIPISGAGEATPLTLSSPQFSQVSIGNRTAQLAIPQFNSGAWDMITLNETGTDAGRYLFTVFETGQAGIQRTDLTTNQTQTIWNSPAPAAHIAFDASYWTPWGTFITAEESWSTAVGGSTSSYGRLFEVTNPLATAPVTAVHRSVIPRVSHEGIQFDSAGRMYFIDELNGGSLYRYTSSYGLNSNFFSGGLSEVFRIGNGTTPNAVGFGTWVPFTDTNGAALAGALTITDTNGVQSVDGRNTTELVLFKGTDYQRPEDLQIGLTADGKELLYMATTTTNEIYAFNVLTNEMSLFANQSTIDLATGLAVGIALRSPDNLAIDAEGNIYIIEDRNGGVDDDIWFAKDSNHDGDLLDLGEGLARWASNGVQGSELTGLYFDPFNPNRAWVNIQHPTSGNDRLMELTASPVPVPAAVWLLGSALAGIAGYTRRKTS